MNSNDIKVKGKLGDIIEIGHDGKGYWKRLAGHGTNERTYVEKAEYQRILDAAFERDMTMVMTGMPGADLRIKLSKWLPYEACHADEYPQPTRAEEERLRLRQWQREQAERRHNRHYGRVG